MNLSDYSSSSDDEKPEREIFKFIDQEFDRNTLIREGIEYKSEI